MERPKEWKGRLPSTHAGTEMSLRDIDATTDNIGVYAKRAPCIVLRIFMFPFCHQQKNECSHNGKWAQKSSLHAVECNLIPSMTRRDWDNHNKKMVLTKALLGFVISILLFLSPGTTVVCVSSLSIQETSSTWHLKKKDDGAGISHDRRGFLGVSLIGSFSLTPSSCQAIGEGDQRMVLTQKPTAPVGALVPAAQQRLLLEKCLFLSQQLINSNDEYGKLVVRMKDILAPVAPSSKKRNDLQILLQSPANLQLRGEVTKAAMNVYTSSLRFPEQLPEYTVTDPSWKKSYIRQFDGLPNVAQVMQADLDLRDLYRNSIVTKLDDASAELHDSLDVVELNQLLSEAAGEFDLWLGRIDDLEVQRALKAALEGKTSKIYDSYYAGFVPLR